MHRLYAPTSLFILLLLCVLVVGLCRVADPYRVFSREDITTNRSLFYFLRTTKAHQLEHGSGDTLFIGSSRIARLRPAAPGAARDAGYNAALPGLSPYEMRHYLRHAALFDRPERLVIFLDYPAFLDTHPQSQVGFSKRRLAAEPEDSGPLHSLYRHADDYRRVLLSATAITDSLHTLLGTHQQALRYFHDGTWEMTPADVKLNRKSKFLLIGRVYHGRAANASNSYDLSELRRIVRWCFEQNVSATFAVSPAHLLTLYAYREAGKLDNYLRWHTDVVNLLQEEAAASRREPFPLHGFQTDFAATAEPIARAPDHPMFLDAVHYTYAYGDLLRDTLLGADGSRGTLLTPESLDSYLAALTARLEAFPASEPGVVEALNRAIEPADQG